MKDAPAGSDALAASVWRLATAGLAGLVVLWMPVTLLRQIDAFLGFATGLELARDVGLAAWLLALVALVLALTGCALSAFARKLGASPRVGHALAWSLVLLPVGWVCVWQLGSAGWAWLRMTLPALPAIGAPQRVAAALAVLAVLAWLVYRGAIARLAQRWALALLALRPLAALVLVAGLGLLLALPPRVLPWRPAPALAAAPTQPAPDIYFITLDTMAAADAAICGEAGPTHMPRLKAFAAQASCFSQHYASANFTTPSTATMETGALPWTHWGVQIVAKMAEPARSATLAALLRAQGYEAHALSANLMASPRHHGSFATYSTEEVADSPSLGLVPRRALSVFADTTLPFWLSSLIPFLDTLDVYQHAEHSPFAPELTYTAALQRLDAAPAGRPQFLWVHTLPPHDPYLPPASSKYKLLPRGELDRWAQMRSMGDYQPAQQALIDKHRLRYREAMMGADTALGEFLDALARRGKLDKALIVISSDHGESFERGFLGHAGDLIHNAVIRVPLVIKLPGQTVGRVVEQPVSLADLAPTMADIAGAPQLATADGRSLAPALRGEALAEAPVFSMAMERQSRFQPLHDGHYAVIDGHFKLVLHLAAGRVELFDLRADPLEQHDLSTQDAATTKRLRALLDAKLNDAEAQRAARFGTPRGH
ncbi:sulfatase family protein [Roseateles paludis]|uniref:Sulfatase-like hydrolase/transferase n=1 Tax=Roseateles paludis TaxID=3145238 RepID=A0ABV0G6E7_9BURK